MERWKINFTKEISKFNFVYFLKFSSEMSSDFLPGGTIASRSDIWSQKWGVYFKNSNLGAVIICRRLNFPLFIKNLNGFWSIHDQW